ncbi:ArsR family transcriptional regulator [Aeromicrobium phragmitis]|uniref:ArsR family transcriptional regulator n=1 Tax=Aeromicrobium phragmitis TaxID=2478914 RepID=A0A3L8PPZ3_9ACTN|nr:metalloregulator ArsR/SmtB family transcription factor [Aeromicrobium phragmitis]RLV57400.1 ArsR family transcriptional regulator [Aeromicrobium phragmitis]
MDVFAAIADPVRRELLVQLSGGPARVVDLAGEHPVSRPAISRHLRVLTDAGLVEADERGRERHYRLRTEPLTEVRTFVSHLERRAPITEHHLDALATEVRRTTRDRRRAAATPNHHQENTA